MVLMGTVVTEKLFPVSRHLHACIFTPLQIDNYDEFYGEAAIASLTRASLTCLVESTALFLED